jgi:membrane-associated protease RseP (regulator of RpoE activity)
MAFMMMSRGRLGVRVQDLNEDLGGYFKAEKGALVTEVLDDTPAKSAGIKGGDVITRVGDSKVENSSDLIDALRGKKGRVTIEVMRRGERRTIEADLGAGSMGNGSGSRRVYRYEVPEGHARNWSDSSDDDSAALKKEIQDLRDEVRELRKQMETSKK